MSDNSEGVPTEFGPVSSLLDLMQPGREYESIVSLSLHADKFEIELRRAIEAVEAARGRPLLCYTANMINPPRGVNTGIDERDELPFSEMVDTAAPGDKVDVLIVTPGGRAEPVSSAVHAVRKKYKDVTAIVPSHAFSAGTLWVLAANEIVMDDRGVLGPIDPQVRASDGRFVPLQSLYALIDEIQERVTKAQKNKEPLPTAWLEVLRTIDKRDLGAAITSSQYSSKMAAEWLAAHKFRDWKTRATSGDPVTEEFKKIRAKEIADLLCDHKTWLSHGHRIRRDDARNILRLQVQDLETDGATLLSVRKLWALLTWIFDKTSIGKLIASRHYTWLLQGTR
jgi:hypothetical protein